MPSLIGEKVGHLCVGADMSGSVWSDAKMVTEFMSEVKSIAEDVRPDRVDLMYWDCEVAGHEEYDSGTVGNIINSTKPKGGGGTDPTCVSRYMKKKDIKPQALIMLTDGEIGDWGTDWDVPVLWVIVGGNRVTAPVGKTIHIRNN
jgi:predicted metal-dependent peptidase